MSDAISKILGEKKSRVKILQQIRAYTVSLLRYELSAASSASDAAKRIGLTYRSLRRIVDAYPDEFQKDYDGAVIRKRRKNQG